MYLMYTGSLKSISCCKIPTAITEIQSIEKALEDEVPRFTIYLIPKFLYLQESLSKVEKLIELLRLN